MIRLVFTINKETFKIEIRQKEIWYLDRRWGKMIRLIPADKNFLRKIVMSRNKIPNYLADLFVLTEKEKQEYESADTDEKLAEVCIKDCKMKGCRLLRRENGTSGS